MLYQLWYPDRTKPTLDLVRSCWQSQIQLKFRYWQDETRSRNTCVGIRAKIGVKTYLIIVDTNKRSVEYFTTYQPGVFSTHSRVCN